MPRLIPTLALGLAGWACTIDDNREPLSHQIDDTRAHLNALRGKVEAHAAAAGAAGDPASVQAMEPMHHDDASAHMEMLGHALEDMVQCDGLPQVGLDAMMLAHERCGEELDRHVQAMSTAAELAATRREEDRHRTTMMDRLDELDEMTDAVMDGFADMMCGGHHRMDDHEG